MKQGLYQVLKSKTWDALWLMAGIILVIISTYYSYTGTVTLVTVTSFIGSILGMIVVLLFANQFGKPASGLGIVGAVLDTFNNYKFGLLGMGMVGVYSFFIYLKGFLQMGKQIKITKVTKSNLYISVLIAIAGSVILYFYGNTILPSGAPIWVTSFNILVFLIQVVSQYLMVEGKAVAWVGLTLVNCINLSLQLYIVLSGSSPTALIYFSMTFMFLLNSIKAVVLWYGFGE